MDDGLFVLAPRDIQTRRGKSARVVSQPPIFGNTLSPRLNSFSIARNDRVLRDRRLRSGMTTWQRLSTARPLLVYAPWERRSGWLGAETPRCLVGEKSRCSPRSLYCRQILNLLNKDRYRRRNFPKDIKIPTGEAPLDTTHNQEEAGVGKRVQEGGLKAEGGAGREGGRGR